MDNKNRYMNKVINAAELLSKQRHLNVLNKGPLNRNHVIVETENTILESVFKIIQILT